MKQLLPKLTLSILIVFIFISQQAYAFTDDIGIYQFTAPTSDSAISNTEQVQVVIFNNGTNNETNFPVIFKYGSTTISTTYKRTLAAATTDTFTVGFFNASIAGTYKMTVCTGLLNDQNKGNDTLKTSIKLSLLAHDISLAYILSPQDGESCPDKNEQVKVEIINYGTHQELNFPFFFVYGSTIVKTFYNRILMPSDTDTLTIGFFNASVNGSYSFSVYSSLLSDLNRTNDTIKAIVNITQPKAPIVDTINHCGPASSTYLRGISTTKGSQTFWYKNLTTDSAFARGDSVKVPYLSKGFITYFAQSQLSDTASLTRLHNKNSALAPDASGYFDIIPKKTIIVDSLAFYGGPGSGVYIYADVYYRVGTYLDGENNPKAWKFICRSRVQCFDPLPTRLPLPPGTSITLPLGATYGFCIVLPTAPLDLDTGGVNTVSNNDLSIKVGDAGYLNFSDIAKNFHWAGTVYYHLPICQSAKLPATITIVQGAQGADITKGTPFQGQLKDGDINAPDNICIGDTNNYQITPPKGLTNTDYGTKWTIISKEASTVWGFKSNDTSFIPPKGANNGQFNFYPTRYGDSIFIVKIHVKTLPDGCDSIITRHIHVWPNPVPNFVFNNACLGTPVNFVDSSKVAASSILNWTWDFGALNQSGTGDSFSISRNNIHAYAKAGSYKVYLTTSTPEGCSRTISKTVTVFSKPSVNFAIGQSCNGYATVFNDSTKISSGTLSSWQWSFGDATSSIIKSPAHTYKKSGPYNVKLVVSSNLGCKDSASTKLRVLPSPVAAFAFTPVCTGLPMYIQNTSVDSISNSGYKWDFGNSATSTQAAPTVTYTTNGTYKINLKITSQNGCFDTLSKNVTPYPKPDVALTLSNGCAGQAAVLTDTINAGKSSTYLWTFGDGSASTLTGSVSTKHTYKNAGNFPAKLVVTNADGCKDTLNKTITIANFPVASFTATTACAGVPIVFANSSTGTGTLSYTWDFGDANAIGSGNDSSKLTSPTHIYSSGGTYTANLIASNANGCANTFTASVTVKPVPVIAPWNTSKHGYQVKFSPVDTGIGKFVWHFGTKANDSSIIKIPTFTYPPTDAKYNVTLTVTNSAGCSASLSDSVSVTKSGIENTANTLKGVSVYPNPFEGVTNISYKLSTPGMVNIEIYDVQGKEIAQLKNGIYPSGQYSDIFDAKKYNAVGGVYFLKMYVGDKYYMTKLVEIR